MAERRMFAKTIIDSDAFLDMPLSTQALYFHLSMRADDEGFVNNPKKIARMIGADDDSLKLLVLKQYIIPFESGVVVIKHWKIHNYIRGDRLTATSHIVEKSQISTDGTGAYTMLDDVKELQALDCKDMRKIAYQNSTLPYSFTYKMRRAFEGKTCPVCKKTMSSAYKQLTPTIQHNKPISQGGEHEIDNISIICLSCNTSIQDQETDGLNNQDVVNTWERIVFADKHKIKWFDNPAILDTLDVMSGICLSSDCQNADDCQTQVRLGKDSIGKDSSVIILSDNNTHGEKRRSRFVPPTLEEVRAYCEERKSGIDPESFIDFYTSKGWMVGKNKMKDWKAAIREWERRRKSEQKQNNSKSPARSSIDLAEAEKRINKF